jgi:uncharacterized protein YecT (DUF1311 family)
MKGYAFSLALMIANPAHLSAQAPEYSDAPTADCLLSALSIADRMACIGAASQDCLAQGGGSIVESFCYDGERAFWDARLNDTYQAALAAAQAKHPDLADALTALQRAWIPYRDAQCDAVFADWGEGTGRSPEFMACQMKLTAQQALMLQGPE